MLFYIVFCILYIVVQDEVALSPADSDSWLNVDPVQLETFLNEKWGNVKSKKYEQESLSVKEKVQMFLNQNSDIDGVQFLEYVIYVRILMILQRMLYILSVFILFFLVFRDFSVETDIIHDSEDNGKIEFDADIFDSTLRGILDLVVPGNEGEFEGSSEGSLGEDNEDKRNEMDKYMRLLDSQLQSEIEKDENSEINKNSDVVEDNLIKSITEEAGGSGPTGNIIGGSARRLLHLQLQSPTTVPPDLQS